METWRDSRVLGTLLTSQTGWPDEITSPWRCATLKSPSLWNAFPLRPVSHPIFWEPSKRSNFGGTQWPRLHNPTTWLDYSGHTNWGRRQRPRLCNLPMWRGSRARWDTGRWRDSGTTARCKRAPVPTCWAELEYPMPTLREYCVSSPRSPILAPWNCSYYSIITYTATRHPQREPKSSPCHQLLRTSPSNSAPFGSSPIDVPVGIHLDMWHRCLLVGDKAASDNERWYRRGWTNFWPRYLSVSIIRKLAAVAGRDYSIPSYRR